MTITRIVAFLFICSTPAFAQDPLGWNASRPLELISRARVRRELPRGDSTLRNYQSKANGYVYFYLDRPGSEERTLVRVDQIALDLYFKRPNLTRQHIVGMRDVNRLPNKMYYHLDHLTVVQNGLGDVIRIGDGDEVRDVPHPAAPGADSIYDYRLADSVTLQLGGDQPSVRVYEIQVRPKRTNRSAMIGSVFVDRNSADIVRMTFTFTPASYVDKRLDYINISLDNGLFGGRYWLPNEQSVEIRRQIPELDFAAGSVIKGRIHIANYQFNANIPDSIFYTNGVTAAPLAQRQSYEFPQDIYGDLNSEGLAPPPQMEDLRARAMELVKEKRLSGLPPLRLYVPNASSVLRRNTTEGWYAGTGITYVAESSRRIDLLGGYAFKAEKPELSLRMQTIGDDRSSFSIRGFVNTPREIHPYPIAPGVLNTLSVTLGNSDYSHLYRASGAEVTWTKPIASTWHTVAGVSVEKQRFTPTPALAREASIGFARESTMPASIAWSGGIRVRGILTDSLNFVRGESHLQLNARTENTRADALLRIDLARNFFGAGLRNAVPYQYKFFVGGRGTIPGYGLREFVASTNLATAKLEVAQTIAYPWLRLRGVAYGAHISDPGYVVGGDVFVYDAVGKTRGSVGFGVGLFWDIIRIDVVKGARWQTLFSVRPDLWDML